MSTKIFDRLWARRQENPATNLRRRDLIAVTPAMIRLLLPVPGNADRGAVEADWATATATAFGARVSEINDQLPKIQDLIIKDAQSLLNGDPAAKTFQEVVLCYPGFFAVAAYRLAHEVGQLGMTLEARVLSSLAHEKTAIDIHPSAMIGEAFCIDHGTGIVIGETAILGRNVKMYQGVTLGALSVRKDMATQKRHPTVGDNVVIYANATLLGPIEIGAGSVIGGNVWLTESVPERSVIKKQ